MARRGVGLNYDVVGAGEGLYSHISRRGVGFNKVGVRGFTSHIVRRMVGLN